MASFEEIRCLDASLAEKLATYTEQLTTVNPEIASAYSGLVNRLMASDAGSQAPEIGAEFPSFVLPDSTGKLLSSTDLLQAGPLIVSFNRGRWCSFCKLELLELASIYQQIKELGGEVISIVPEGATSTKFMKEAMQIPFPLLTDIDNGFALNCGLMISLGDAARELILKAGANLSDYQGNDSWFVPIPATFILDTSGVVTDRFVDVDFRNRMPLANILNSLKKFN